MKSRSSIKSGGKRANLSKKGASSQHGQAVHPLIKVFEGMGRGALELAGDRTNERAPKTKNSPTAERSGRTYRRDGRTLHVRFRSNSSYKGSNV